MRFVEFLKDESGFLGALGGLIAGKLFGGGAIAKGIGTFAGNLLGRRIGASEDRRNARLDYRQQRELGFTHSEIAGSGGAGAGETSQTIMGNQQTQFEAQRRAQEFEMMERDKDRAVSMRAQDMGLQSAQVSAGATLGAARTAYEASFHSANTQYDIAALHNDRMWQQMANDWANNNPELNMRFKQMSQGVANGQMDILLQQHRLTPQEMRGITYAERDKRFEALMDDLAIISGWNDTLREGIRGGNQVFGDVLGTRSPGLPQSRPPNLATPPMPTMGNNSAPVYNTTPR